MVRETSWQYAVGNRNAIGSIAGGLNNYELQIKNYVTLAVYNIAGQKIKTLVNEKQNAGERSVSFDAAELPMLPLTHPLPAPPAS